MTIYSKVEVNFFEKMGDWLHCNSCFRQPGSGRNYFLTNCGHIYCENCQDKGWKERCLLCGTGHPSSFKLTSKLPPPVDAYFSDPIKMLKQTASEMKQILAATEFQHHQRKRFMTHLQKNVSNQKAIVEKCEKELKAKTLTVFAQLEKEKTKYQNESRQLKEENKYLKVLLSEKGQTPIRSPSGDRLRPDSSNSPATRGYGSPCNFNQPSRGTPSEPFKNTPGSTIMTSGRICVRTPPTGGRMGVIPDSTPSPKPQFNKTPKSVPHPINFDWNMETSPK